MSTPKNNPIDVIKAQNISAFFNSFQAVKNISLNVQDHRVLALIGPSGCGKSTFLRCLNRLHEEVPGARVTGQVKLDGADIYARGVNPVEVRSKIGMVFQKPNPFPAMSIFENVVAGLRIKGIGSHAQHKEIAERCLKQAALWDEVKDKLSDPGVSLSGGQQQRLCIARALAVNPRVLLMDEPTSALDPIATTRIEELIHKLKEDVAIVIVTHNMSQAMRVADRTAFFLLGEMLECADTSLLFKKPQHEKTQKYVSGQFG